MSEAKLLRDYQPGDSIPALTKPPITKTQLVKYSGASGDFNPIHTVEEYAVAAGLGGVIAHGALTMAFVGQMLSDWVGLDGWLEEWQVRFSGMVRPGDVITCEGEVKEREEADGVVRLSCRLKVMNQNGEQVMRGTANVSC
jgi:acyl dehydratase